MRFREYQAGEFEGIRFSIRRDGSVFRTDAERRIMKPSDQRTCRMSATAHFSRQAWDRNAATYETIWNEKLLPAKAEETLQRLITAYHLAGDIPTSEARIATFKQQFPNSTLMPLVAFRSAENHACSMSAV